MYYHTRSQFLRGDFDFIARVLGRAEAERAALIQLTNDPESLAQLLHDRRLFEQSLASPPALVTISPQLFFYLFVYNALADADIKDDDLADYVAAVCLAYRSNEALWHPASTAGGKTIYLVDLLTLKQELGEEQQYYLSRYIGDVTLFMTAFFPDFIFRRNKMKGAPAIEYYENIGRGEFDAAATRASSFDEEAGPILASLAEQFVRVRSALNVFIDMYLALGKGRNQLARIERQASTLGENFFRRSLDA